MEIYLDISHFCEYSHRSHEQFGDWGERWDVSYGNIAGSEHNYSWERAVIDGELNVGDDIYAIVAVWSSGDSFGNDYRGSLDVVIVNRNPQLAYENLKKIEDTGEDDWTVDLTMDNGETVKYYMSWKGYFECLDDLVIRKFTYLG